MGPDKEQWDVQYFTPLVGSRRRMEQGEPERSLVHHRRELTGIMLIICPSFSLRAFFPLANICP